MPNAFDKTYNIYSKTRPYGFHSFVQRTGVNSLLSGAKQLVREAVEQGLITKADTYTVVFNYDDGSSVARYVTVKEVSQPLLVVN